MPRKVNHGVDYDDYDDYYDDNYEEDYSYDQNHDVEVNTGEVTGSKQETATSKLWRCSICTYDNDESFSACDICGVLRRPLINNHSNKRSDDGICRDSGVSKMAKSLFASMPHQRPKKIVLFQLQNDDTLKGEGDNVPKLGNTPNFHQLYEAFSSYRHPPKIKIEPFNFNVPSPDDIVSNGLHVSKMSSKAAHTVKNVSTKVSADVSKNNGTVDTQVITKKPESVSAFMQEDRKDIQSKGDILGSSAAGKIGNVDSNSRAKTTVYVESSNTLLDGSSSSLSEVKHDRLDESSSSSSNQNLASSLHDMSLSVTSQRAKIRKVTSSMPFKPEKWMLPNESENMSQLNLAIVGHVDSGKSTLSGRLLHLLGRISQKEMHKYVKEAKLQGKGSFAYAWALDESTEERERGITMTVAVAYFDSKKYHVVVLDSPGHKDFVPNMISGATQADAAILVIDASMGAFEAGIDSKKGQTKEHAQLIRSFGVDQVIVVVNKMDAVGYSKDRFETIKQQLKTFLRTCGFRDSNLSWIPLSAIENQNLVAAPSDKRFVSWYKGPYLLDAIDSFQLPTRDFSRPLIMPICDVIKPHSMSQISACGKLEAGALRSGLKVMAMPSGEVGTIRSIERDSQACSVARAGENVSIALQGIDGSHVMAGGVLCHPDFPVSVAKRLELKILVLDVATPILIGSQLEFYVHHAKESATVVKILSLLDSKTGKVTKKAPRCVVAKQSAVLEVDLHGPVCVEDFSSCRALGRVSLRSLGKTIAVGIVSKIVEEQE